MEFWCYFKLITGKKQVLFLCLLLSAFHANAGEKIYLAYSEHCPYTCIDKADNSVIFTLMQEVYEREGIEVEFVIVPYARALKLINSGRIAAQNDAQIIHAIFTVKSDKQNLIFPEMPVVKDQQCFYRLKENKWQYEPTNLDHDIMLAIQSGSNYPAIAELTEVLKAKRRLVEMSPSLGFEQMFQMLLKGRVDAIYDVVTSIEYVAKNLNVQDKIVKGWCESDFIEGYIGFSKNYPKKAKRWKAIWDKNYPKLLAEGKFDHLFEKYSLTKPIYSLPNS